MKSLATHHALPLLGMESRHSLLRLREPSPAANRFHLWLAMTGQAHGSSSRTPVLRPLRLAVSDRLAHVRLGNPSRTQEVLPPGREDLLRRGGRQRIVLLPIQVSGISDGGAFPTACRSPMVLMQIIRSRADPSRMHYLLKTQIALVA